ncbi:MAG: IS66 family insertion sequence element accessory protein TnpB [Gaiellales bacterium]
MIQLTPQMRILVAIEAQDFRKGIDGLARVCHDVFEVDPFGGTLFVFRNRRGTALKCLVYDSQGFWLAHKRLSRGRFRWWPTHPTDTAAALEAHQLQRLIMGGDPAARDAAPVWRRIRTG